MPVKLARASQGPDGKQLLKQKKLYENLETSLMATVMVHGRVDEDVKRRAGKVLASMGLRPSDVIRVLFTRIAKDKTLPFDVCPLPHGPNAKTRTAIK